MPHRRVSAPLRPRAAAGAAALALAALLAAGPAAADPAAGAAVARQWCANCHAVAPGQRTTDAAPSFTELVGRADLGRERLRGWLSTPHAGMPDLSLSRQDVDAVIDYLQSLSGADKASTPR